MVLKNHLLTIVILPLLILFVAASYYRFMVLQDYLVTYEGDCDPYTQSCHLYCYEWDDEDKTNDEQCDDPFYFSLIERHANDIYTLCGSDVSECDAAYECPETEPSCSISFCDPNTDEGCVTLEPESVEAIEEGVPDEIQIIGNEDTSVDELINETI